MKEKTYHPIRFLCYFLVLTLILCSIQLPVSAENKESEMSVLSLYQSEDGFTTYWVDENGDRVYIDSDKNEDGIDYAPMLPTSYDSRENNIITSVKSQGNSGTCWAFSTISCMETSAIKNGLANVDEIDLSEDHLVWYTYKNKTTDEQDGTYGDGYDIDAPYNKGGSWLSSIFTLARGSGAALDTKYPFMDENTSYTQDDMYVSNIRMYSAEALGTDGKSTNSYIFDQTKVKQAIINNGSVKASYYSNNGYTLNNYNKTAANGTAYYQKENYSSNHAITIVGWDDNYSRLNFKSDCQPISDGAWLVKNSWGNASILTDGYFWLSYEEPTIDGIVKYTAAANDIYDNIYQYDGIGYGQILHSTGRYSLKEANVFTAKKSEKLTHVGFYTVQSNLNYSVEIYTDIKSDYSSPTNDTPSATFSGTAENEGYRTVQIPTEINLNKDEIFSVVVTLSSPNKEEVYLPIEGKLDPCPYSSKSKQSYYAFGNNWYDSSADSNNNVCIKAMTKDYYCQDDEHSFIYDGENITCSECDYSEPATGFTGFVNDKNTNGLMYLKNGTPTKGWIKDENNNYYYFGNNFIAYTEQNTIEGHTYTFDENGKLIKGAWDVTDSGVSYLWADKNVSVWQYIDGAIYYFNPTTFYRTTTAQSIDGKYYAFTNDGKLQLISGSIKIGDLYYSFDENGIILTDHINDHAYNPVTFVPETINATCTDDGKEVKKCLDCEKREEHVLKATGHKAVVDSAVAPTCVKSGLTEGSHCSVCNAKITTQSVIPALGHNFGEWTVSVPATCSSRGTEIRTCSVCGKTESRDISMSAHLHTQLINKKTATCTDNGYTGDLICTDCKTVISKGVITNKTAHTIVTDSAVAPTCTKTGLTSGSHCSVCGTVIKKQNVIEALGHNFGEWQVVTPATEISVGEITHYCIICNYCESKTIELLTTATVTTTNPPVITTQATTAPSTKPSVTTTQTTTNPAVKPSVITAQPTTAPTTFNTVTAVTPTETSTTAPETDTTASVTEIPATVPPTAPTTDSTTVVAPTANNSSVTESTTDIIIQDYILGDVNDDGHVTASDARLALRISAALESSTDLQRLVADVDFNKKITASDARKILRFSANLEKF